MMTVTSARNQIIELEYTGCRKRCRSDNTVHCSFHNCESECKIDATCKFVHIVRIILPLAVKYASSDMSIHVDPLYH